MAGLMALEKAYLMAGLRVSWKESSRVQVMAWWMVLEKASLMASLKGAQRVQEKAW